MNNDQITMMQGCQDFMSLMRSLSDEGRAELIQVFRSAQMGGGAGGNPPTPMPTVNSGENELIMSIIKIYMFSFQLPSPLPSACRAAAALLR